MKVTQRTMRCPLDECSAVVTVRTDPTRYPSRRYRDVIACSLRPPTSFVPLARRTYFTDLAPLMSYVCDVGEIERLELVEDRIAAWLTERYRGRT